MPGNEATGLTGWGRRMRIIWVLKALVLGIIIYYVARAMGRQLREVPWQQIDFQPQYLVGALLLTGVAIFMSAAAYRVLIAGFTRPPSLAAMCAVTWLPLLGKYVPGKVASVAGAIWLLSRCGVPADMGASIVMVQQVLGLLTGFLLAIPLGFWQPVREQFPHAWPCLIAGPLAGLVFLHPAVLRPAANWALRRFGRPPLSSVPSFRQYLPAIIINIVGWIALGAATWMVARSMIPVSPSLLPVFAGVTALANSLGILTLIPGGLGVREGIMLVILTPLAGPVTSMVAVVMRLVVTLVEVILSGLALLLLRGVPREEKDQSDA